MAASAVLGIVVRRSRLPDLVRSASGPVTALSHEVAHLINSHSAPHALVAPPDSTPTPLRGFAGDRCDYSFEPRVTGRRWLRRSTGTIGRRCTRNLLARYTPLSDEGVIYGRPGRLDTGWDRWILFGFCPGFSDDGGGSASTKKRFLLMAHVIKERTGRPTPPGVARTRTPVDRRQQSRAVRRPQLPACRPSSDRHDSARWFPHSDGREGQAGKTLPTSARGMVDLVRHQAAAPRKGEVAPDTGPAGRTAPIPSGRPMPFDTNPCRTPATPPARLRPGDQGLEGEAVPPSPTACPP